MLARLNQPEKIEDGPADLAVISPGETVVVFCVRVTPTLAGTLEGLARIRKVVCKVLQLPDKDISPPFTVMELLPDWQDNKELAVLLLGEEQGGGLINEEAIAAAGLNHKFTVRDLLTSVLIGPVLLAGALSTDGYSAHPRLVPRIKDLLAALRSLKIGQDDRGDRDLTRGIEQMTKELHQARIGVSFLRRIKETYFRWRLK